MARARYNSELPSAHLKESDFSDLEYILKDNDEKTEIEIILETNQLIYEFSSTTEMFEDSTLPAFVRDFEVKAESELGEVRITSDSGDNEIELAVNGEQEWVKAKVRKLEDFFNKRGDKVRTLLQEHSFKGIVGLVGGGGALAHYSGFGEIFGITELGDVIFYGFMALVAWGMVMNILNYIHPYSLVVLRAEEEFRPYVTKMVTLLTVVAAVVALVGFVLRLGLLS